MEQETSTTTKDAVWKDFNPSGKPLVAALKNMTASLVTMMEEVRDQNNGMASEEATTAIMHLHTASMWCVLAATKGL